VLKKGDLLKFNEQGMALFKHCTGSVGVLVSKRKVLYEYKLLKAQQTRQYYGFDILVSGQLFKDIPEEFLIRIIINEEDTK